MSFTDITSMMGGRSWNGAAIGAAVGGGLRQSKLGQLANQYANAGDPVAQKAAIQSANAFDPDTGAQMQSKMEGDQAKAQQVAAKAARYVLTAWKAGGQSAADQAQQAVNPWLAEIGKATGKVPPQTFDQANLPHLEALAAMDVEGQGDSVQSTYINRAGERVAIMRDGSQKVLGAAENRLQALDYGDRSVAFDPRTATVRELGVQQQPQQVQAANAPMAAMTQGGQQIQLDPSLPESLRAQIAANPDAFEAAAQGNGSFTPPTVAQVQAPRKGMSPQAAQSQANSDRDFGLQKDKFSFDQQKFEEQGRREAVKRAEVAAQKATTAAEKAQKQQQADNARQAAAAQASNQLIDAIDGLEKHPGFAELGTVWGDAKLNTPLVRNDVKDAHAQLKNVAGQIALATMSQLRALSSQGATGFGALSAPELKLLENSIATLQSDQISNAQLKESLKVIKDSMRKAATWRAGGASPNQLNAPKSDDVSDLLEKYK